MHGNELREWSTGEGLGVLRPWELREWSALWVFTDAAPAPAGVGGYIYIYVHMYYIYIYIYL